MPLPSELPLSEHHCIQTCSGSTRRASKKRSLTLLLLNSTEKFVFLDHKFWHPSKDVCTLSTFEETYDNVWEFRMPI